MSQSVIQSTKGDLQQQVQALKKQNQRLQKEVQQLKTDSQNKDKKILLLGEKICELTKEANRLAQDLKTKEVLITNYHHNLYNKNVQMQRSEAELEKGLNKKIEEKNKAIRQLEQIVSQQNKQIQQLMTDHEMMLISYSEAYRFKQIENEERQILKSYNSELERQIKQIEDQNEILINEVEQSRLQLQLQNQQGEDLISQVKAMVYHLQVDGRA